jgi:hypothetical protein
MDEIFLNDYTNIPMAQQPNGLAAIYQQPGFENYTPSYSVADQPMVNQDLNLLPEGGINLPPLKDIAGNIIQDRLKSYALKKIGLDGLKGNILKGIVNPYVGLATLAPFDTNPLNVLQDLNTRARSTLFAKSATMSDYLAAKRAQKAAERDYRRDTQGDITTVPVNILNMEPTAQDIYRGGGPDRSSSTTSTSSARSARHTAGPGGLHSGY